MDSAEIDPYEEHWGESAYVVALAWHWSGRADAELRTAALSLVDGLGRLGEAGQLRSFNWQCRSAPMAAYFLRQWRGQEASRLTAVWYPRASRREVASWPSIW